MCHSFQLVIKESLSNACTELAKHLLEKEKEKKQDRRICTMRHMWYNLENLLRTLGWGGDNYYLLWSKNGCRCSRTRLS